MFCYNETVSGDDHVLLIGPKKLHLLFGDVVFLFTIVIINSRRRGGLMLYGYNRRLIHERSLFIRMWFDSTGLRIKNLSQNDGFFITEIFLN